MEVTGYAHCFGRDINTDYIISAQAKERAGSIGEMVPFLMEDIEPGFSRRIRPGDLILAGANFGCGSSREAAPAVIKAAGIGGVVATSFARIFYRNAVNVGLPVLICPTDGIQSGERLTVDFSRGLVRSEDRTFERRGEPLPDFLQEILSAGGLIPYFREHGRFVVGEADG